jgi:hypothetical protein
MQTTLTGLLVSVHVLPCETSVTFDLHSQVLRSTQLPGIQQSYLSQLQKNIAYRLQQSFAFPILKNSNLE